MATLPRSEWIEWPDEVLALSQVAGEWCRMHRPDEVTALNATMLAWLNSDLATEWTMYLLGDRLVCKRRAA